MECFGIEGSEGESMGEEIDEIISECNASHQDSREEQIPDDGFVDNMIIRISRAFLHEIFLCGIPGKRRQWSHFSDHIHR